MDFNEASICSKFIPKRMQNRGRGVIASDEYVQNTLQPTDQYQYSHSI